jgi:hypothetical protein
MNLPFADQTAPATFLIGGAGAGKTELALNLSVYKASHYKSSTLIDLDIVNPFFRVRKLREEVGQRGVAVICPEHRVVSGDIPALPAAAWGVLETSDKPVVCDIGGGEPGLRPLGRLKDIAEQRRANVLFVINPFRPGFSNLEEMAASYKHMCGLSAMQVTHIIANPNLSGDTSPELFNEGLALVKSFASSIGTKLGFAVAANCLAADLGVKSDSLPGFYDLNGLTIFVLERYWSVPWHFGVVV